jgi:hypothetical protein
MAKSKVPKVEDLNGYLFMAINGTDVNLVYHDDTDNGLALGAALASVLEQDAKLFDIISAAMLTVLEAKEKYSSKKSNKLPKTVKKEAKKK